jgi:hypothetical protein
MSKKSKLKRKKYETRDEFIHAVCSRCGLCKLPVIPEFCYNCAYKDDPKKFTKIIQEQLFDVKHWLSNAGYPSIAICPDEPIQYILQTIFCESNFCGKFSGEDKQCKAIVGCLHALRRQIKGVDNLVMFNEVCNSVLNGTSPSKVIDYQEFKNRKKQKHKNIPVIVPRMPTFFCNEGFKKEIGEILDGSNYREQDKN